MSKVRIVTDSTADLPRQLVDLYGITVVPLTVHFGPEEYKDYVELTPDDFFGKLGQSPHLPRTSQPSPADFKAAYEAAAKKADWILSIHISAALSGTCQSAVMARDMLPGLDIEILDTRSASLGVGLAVLAAARAAEAGADRAEILGAARRVIDRSHVFFAVDTLEYLEKNGRIGKAQALLGGLLKIKPVLTLDNGVVAPFEKVRGKPKVIPRLAEIAAERLGGARVRAAVVHGAAPEEAEALKNALAAKLDVEDMLIGQIGAVIGCHTGPGVLGWIAHPV